MRWPPVSQDSRSAEWACAILFLLISEPETTRVIRKRVLCVCLLFGAALAATGCSSQEDLSKCRSTDPDIKIAGCTALIQTGNVTTQDLSTFYNNRGAAYFDKHDFDRAIQDYNEAIRLNPKLATSFYGRGDSYDHKGDFDRAIQDQSEAIRLDPKFAYAYDARGRAHRNKGDFDQAIEDYSEAIRLNPNYALALNNRGDSYRSKGDYTLALRDFNDAIRLNPKLASAYNNRGFVHFMQLNLAAAIEEWDQVIAFSPSSKAAVLAAMDLHIAMRRLGRDDVERLSSVASAADLLTWPGPVLRLDLGQMTADQVVAAAAHASAEQQKWQVCEANYFTGEDALIHHQRATAISRLNAARDGCPKTEGSYAAALAELRRLGEPAGGVK
ncbi:tetratricopeptide repeat protein [Acidobacteria bacterium AB60]|nr:tetratricopeptide repeat protein [Acidobacteria bacterium AB60]